MDRCRALEPSLGLVTGGLHHAKIRFCFISHSIHVLNLLLSIRGVLCERLFQFPYDKTYLIS